LILEPTLKQRFERIVGQRLVGAAIRHRQLTIGPKARALGASV
jgi:hypothetical protein